MPPRQSRREFLSCCGPAAVIALGAAAARGDAASPAVAASPHKALTRLRAKALDGEVRLSVYKSTPAFQDKKGQDRFRALRVYRREEPAFTFGQDYEEYFDGLSYHDAELIFQGSLEAGNNRNYPADWETVDYTYGLDTSDPDSMTYRGPAPASEPETRAVMEFLRANAVQAVFSFHCLASICGAHLLGPKCGAKDEVYAKKCKGFATTYGLGMDRSQPADGVLGFGTSAGSLPAWCCRELGIPAFDLEISARETEAREKCVVDRTDRPLLADYQQRHTNGLRAVLEAMVDGEL